MATFSRRTQNVSSVLTVMRFSPSEDGQEGPVWFLQSHGKVIQLLLHQEASCLLRKIHSHHGAVARKSRGLEVSREQQDISVCGIVIAAAALYLWAL